MATKIDKLNETKLKRLSKGKGIHILRLKQEARETAGITPTHA
jgi:hypothetical protein